VTAVWPARLCGDLGAGAASAGSASAVLPFCVMLSRTATGTGGRPLPRMLYLWELGSYGPMETRNLWASGVAVLSESYRVPTLAPPPGSASARGRAGVDAAPPVWFPCVDEGAGRGLAAPRCPRLGPSRFAMLCATSLAAAPGRAAGMRPSDFLCLLWERRKWPSMDEPEAWKLISQGFAAAWTWSKKQLAALFRGHGFAVAASL